MRTLLVNEFCQEDSQIKVFLASVKAAGTGLNLVRANHVVLLDPWWNAATEGTGCVFLGRV
jgi:SNF2 family DNA or RNA helicase